LLSLLPASTGAAPLWHELAPGIHYRLYYLPGPNRAYVARLDRQAQAATIEASLGMGRVAGGMEPVRLQAARYDQTIGYWGEQWGSRSRVVVAINGSYFDTLTGVPAGGVVQGGWYARRFADLQNVSGFVWTLDRQAFVGLCVQHRAAKQVVSVPGRGQIKLDAINTLPGEDELALFTHHYDVRTPQFESGEGVQAVEVVVQLRQPLLIVPEPRYVSGVALAVRDEGGAPLAFDQIVLSARGEAAQELRAGLRVGDEVRISQELRHLSADCKQPVEASWSKTYASVGGGYVFLKDGRIQPLDDLGAVVRNPRTAVAYNGRFVYFIVVDGRDRLRSVGMSMVELAEFARTRLAAAWGVAQDGGGSSTMVVDGEVVNHPNADLGDFSGAPASGDEKIERAVANGLMMVAVEPPQFSARFAPGQQVRVSEGGPVNVRLGPGVNYAILEAVPDGATGVTLEHPLNGVQATGYAWWLVQVNGVVGWVNEASLAAGQ
jgi:hypothetical protein